MNPVDIAWYTALIFKLFVLLGLGIYAIFAYIIVRQEQLMAKTFRDATEPALRIMALGHFFASLGVIVLALFLL